MSKQTNRGKGTKETHMNGEAHTFTYMNPIKTKTRISNLYTME